MPMKAMKRKFGPKKVMKAMKVIARSKSKGRQVAIISVIIMISIINLSMIIIVLIIIILDRTDSKECYYYEGLLETLYEQKLPIYLDSWDEPYTLISEDEDDSSYSSPDEEYLMHYLMQYH